MDINDVIVFVRVAQAGSFSRAAKRLGMPVSTVSRRVAELESELGVPLLLRTTRRLKITDAGSAYLAHGLAIAAEIEKAELLATHLSSIPQGRLKVTAATDFGNQFLGPLMSGFLRENPQVDLDLVLTERVVDLIEEGFDVAIRMGELDDSSLVARKIGNIDSLLYASPEFIAEHGEPKTPAELADFECIRFTGEDDHSHWRLKGARGEARVKVSGRVSSNNMILVRDLVASGKGIALMPYFLCGEEIKAGRVKVLLPDWGTSSGPIHVVYPAQRFLLPKVRAFVDYLVTHNQLWKESL